MEREAGEAKAAASLPPDRRGPGLPGDFRGAAGQSFRRMGSAFPGGGGLLPAARPSAGPPSLQDPGRPVAGELAGYPETGAGRTGPGSLTPERIARLDALGMEWNNKWEASWERHYAAAQEYYREHGNLEVPARYVSPDGTALGSWLVHQRQQRAGHLCSGCSMRNASAGWMPSGWYGTPSAPSGEQITRRPPATCRARRSSCARRISDERRFCAGQLGTQSAARLSGRGGAPPTKEQQERLERIGMCWDGHYSADWNRYYEAAREYAGDTWDLAVPVGYRSPDGLALGKWLYRQRRAQRCEGRTLSKRTRRPAGSAGDEVGAPKSRGKKFEIEASSGRLKTAGGGV